MTAFAWVLRIIAAAVFLGLLFTGYELPAATFIFGWVLRELGVIEESPK
jgi:hypothetical protein